MTTRGNVPGDKIGAAITAGAILVGELTRADPGKEIMTFARGFQKAMRLASEAAAFNPSVLNHRLDQALSSLADLNRAVVEKWTEEECPLDKDTVAALAIAMDDVASHATGKRRFPDGDYERNQRMLDALRKRLGRREEQ